MAFLGSSRGLGQAVVEEFVRKKSDKPFLLVSRTQKLLEELHNKIPTLSEPFVFDLSRSENLEPLLEKFHENQVSRLFYFAGGGPFGLFPEKKWKDHQWGLNVTFLTPARIIHACMTQPELKSVKQIICIGSQLADSEADPFSATYAGAKHGLKGLVDSLIAEKSSIDLRLFRPGYMDTSMLPKNARPRVEGETIVKPGDAARIFVTWANDPTGPKILDLEV